MHDDVLQLAKLYFLLNSANICDFLRFQISEKWSNLWLPLNVQKQKVFQLQGLRPSDPLTRRSASGPRWGLRPQIPVWGAWRALRARHAPFVKS